MQIAEWIEDQIIIPLSQKWAYGINTQIIAKTVVKKCDDTLNNFTSCRFSRRSVASPPNEVDVEDNEEWEEDPGGDWPELKTPPLPPLCVEMRNRKGSIYLEKILILSRQSIGFDCEANEKQRVSIQMKSTGYIFEIKAAERGGGY